MRLYDNDAYREDFMQTVYDLLSDDATNDRANQIIEAFDAAPCVVAEVLPPNEPLSLEQLLEMEGEPVWVENLDVSGKSMWEIVQTWADDTLVMRGAHQCGCLVDRYSIGQRYRVYRCKPEGNQGRKHNGL